MWWVGADRRGVRWLAVLQGALDFNGDGNISSREVSLILKTFYTGRVSDRRIRLLGEEVMDQLCEGRDDSDDVDVTLLSSIVGRLDYDTRLTAYF
jgi:hypothetical protein